MKGDGRSEPWILFRGMAARGQSPPLSLLHEYVKSPPPPFPRHHPHGPAAESSEPEARRKRKTESKGRLRSDAVCASTLVLGSPFLSGQRGRHATRLCVSSIRPVMHLGDSRRRTCHCALTPAVGRQVPSVPCRERQSAPLPLSYRLAACPAPSDSARLTDPPRIGSRRHQHAKRGAACRADQAKETSGREVGTRSAPRQSCESQQRQRACHDAHTQPGRAIQREGASGVEAGRNGTRGGLAGCERGAGSATPAPPRGAEPREAKPSRRCPSGPPPDWSTRPQPPQLSEWPLGFSGCSKGPGVFLMTLYEVQAYVPTVTAW